ncbi:putative ubiquitin-conjugating enzyme E2, ATP synthase, F1 complex, delta/epsilon subunit [Helianthus anomalus]
MRRWDCLPGHVPTIAELKPGLLSVHEGNEIKKYFISSGFAFIHPNSIADILAIEAVPLDRIDPAQVQKGLTEFTQKLSSASTDSEKAEAQIEGGIYHGRIQLPSEYPFKPPSFMLLTPNGRYETQIKICLSISNHHPDATAGEQASESPQDTSTGITEHEEQQREENNEVANAVPSASSSVHVVEPQQQQVLGVQKPADDHLFTWAAVGLNVAIMVLLLKKFMKASGHGAVFMDES